MGAPEVPLEHAQEELVHHAETAHEAWIMKVALSAAILAVAAISVLTKRKWFWLGSLLFGAIGGVLFVFFVSSLVAEFAKQPWLR